jgi:hypothetical protein
MHAQEEAARTIVGAACNPATKESRRSGSLPGSSISHGVPRLKINGTPGKGSSRNELGLPRACVQASGARRRYGLSSARGSRRATSHRAASVSCRSTNTHEVYDAARRSRSAVGVRGDLSRSAIKRKVPPARIEHAHAV